MDPARPIDSAIEDLPTARAFIATLQEQLTTSQREIASLRRKRSTNHVLSAAWSSPILGTGGLAMTNKRTPAQMTRLVAQWRASGESRAGFARRRHIPAWTFWYWCRKLSAEPRTESDNPPPATFVPVRMAVEPDAPVIEIVWSGGERLHVRPGASPDLVRAVVTALRSPC